MTDSSASSLTSPEPSQDERQSRGLDTRAIALAQDHQKSTFRDRMARNVGIKSRQSTSDGLSREKEPQLQLTSIPSTPISRRLAPPDLSPATPSVRRRLFSSPPIPLEFPDPNRPPGCLGLGITGSPSAGRTQIDHHKRIVAGKGAQAKPTVSIIKENVNPDPTSDAAKNNNLEEHRKRHRKQTQRRLQNKNQKKRIRMKMESKKMKMTEMKKSREKNVQPQVQSSHCSDSRNSTATNQLHSHFKSSGDESASQIADSSLPLAQESPRNPAAEATMASNLNKRDSVPDTDSDSTSDSDIDVLAELFPRVEPEPPKPAATAYRGWVPPYGGDYNHPDYYDACVREGVSLGLPGRRIARKKSVGKKITATSSRLRNDNQ